MTPEIDRPIFIVGSGRGGTSMLFQLLSAHRQCGWFSTWSIHAPGCTPLALAGRLADLFPVRLRKWRGWPKPHVEANEIYRYCGIHDLLWQHRRPLEAEDVPAAATRCFKELVARHLAWQGRPRWIHKNVNNSMRIKYLNAIFPDARFIHIVRDGRAVAQSLSQVWFWPNLRLWWCNRTVAELLAEGEEPLVLCGRHWRHEVTAVLNSVNELPPERFMQVHYEDITAAPERWAAKLFAFCELPPDDRWRQWLASTPVSNRNRPCAALAGDGKADALWSEIGETMERLGYSR